MAAPMASQRQRVATLDINAAKIARSRQRAARGVVKPAPRGAYIRLDAVRSDRQHALPSGAVELPIKVRVHVTSSGQRSGAPERLGCFGRRLQARDADVAQRVIVEMP
jgi:hypothetical protein